MDEITVKTTSFDSSDGKHKIYTVMYVPAGRPRGIIQFAHGMTEHFGRYREMGEFFARAGYVFAGCDHLGHGKSVNSEEELGFFAEEDGADTVVSDLFKLTRLLKGRYPSLPFFLAGHSMGSFLVRLYAMTYSRELQGLIAIGTGGPKRAVGLGKRLTTLIGAFRGSHYRSKLIKRLASGGYLSRCEKGADSSAWLSTDESVVETYKNDPLSGFTFTVRAYYDLFDMVERTNTKKLLSRYPKELPVLLMAGGQDPVGDYGRGPKRVQEMLTNAGLTDVTLHIYPEARHELHNETCRHRFFSELLEWVEAHCHTGGAC